MEVKDGTGIQATISGTASCPPPATVEWDFCSAEQDQCSCSNSSQFVRFGAEISDTKYEWAYMQNPSWKEQQPTASSFVCNANNVGSPVAYRGITTQKTNRS